MSMVDIVGAFIPLKRAGSVWKGLCPFHKDERTKSFVVYQNSAYCFGCRSWYNPERFLMEYKNFSWAEAKDWLDDRGIALEHAPVVRREAQNEAVPISKKVIEFWHSQVEKARGYFHSRMLTDATIDLFKLGWDGKRYTLPIWEGKPGDSLVYSVKKRAVEGVFPKYLNLKGHGQPRLFNSFCVKGSESVYIFFGEFDALLAWQDGVSAISGTAGKDVWLSAWSKLVEGKKVFVVPDRDELKAAWALRKALGAEVLTGLQGKDYTEHRQNGGELIQTLHLQKPVIVKQNISPFWALNDKPKLA